ncbi:hypothetical protein B0H17DRAFT_1214619 [Mycena rosella]|uniref:SLM1/RGC1-like BAR-like domain-containing protein n=1 Tax=Mycena rosella TaxID=1033263 RepID=A0AAD7G097_MYCRO|nr:hypothetical protein B0H17DRAFT_1214619 [Mycena rosella]
MHQLTKQNSMHFEEGIVHALQAMWQTYNEWQVCMGALIVSIHTELAAYIAHLTLHCKWLAFSKHRDHLLDPETCTRATTT